MRRRTVEQVLTARMRAKGWSQVELARSLGVTQGAISKWMAGVRRPRNRVIRARLLDWGVDPRVL